MSFCLCLYGTSAYRSVEEDGSVKRIFRDLIHQPQEDVQNYVVRFSE